MAERQLSFETVGSISAIVVAVASLFVAWDEARSVRRQQAASVLPILKIQTPFMNAESERSYRIEVHNVGVGPAFVDAATMTWNGDPLGMAEQLRFNVEELAGASGFWTADLEGQVPGGGETNLLFEVSWVPDDEGGGGAGRRDGAGDQRGARSVRVPLLRLRQVLTHGHEPAGPPGPRPTLRRERGATLTRQLRAAASARSR